MVSCHEWKSPATVRGFFANGANIVASDQVKQNTSTLSVGGVTPTYGITGGL